MTLMQGTVLVLGGARSGKSRFAERAVSDTGLERHYVATGRAFDEEMRARIASHQVERGSLWETHEEPVDLCTLLSKIDHCDRAILVDCLTLWVTNLMMDGRDIEHESAELCRCLSSLEGCVVLVSNEVGLGIVPDNRMARDFRDHAGRLHQAVAAVADKVYFVAAGLPLLMKG